MTRRVTVEFATEEAAERFRQYVSDNQDVIVEFGKFNDPLIETVPAKLVDEQPLLADAMRSQIKVRIGTRLYEIQRTEHQDFFLGADLEGQIDMLTIPIRELVYRHYNEWKEVST